MNVLVTVDRELGTTFRVSSGPTLCCTPTPGSSTPEGPGLFCAIRNLISGVGMPILGAFAGTRKPEQTTVVWRWASGVSAAVLLGLTLFGGCGFVETAYYDYILFFPREKAGEDYIMPLRWQNIVAEVSGSFNRVLSGWITPSFDLLAAGPPSGVKRILKSRSTD